MSRVLDLWAGLTGTVLDFAGATAPTGWLLCYGQSLLRTDYPNLFAAIGTAHGAADGTHFSLPDCRGRVGAGKDNMGGTAASRLTNSGTGNPGVDGATLGASGGVDRLSLTIAQMPAHTHTFVQATGSNVALSGSTVTVMNSSGTQPSGSAGTGDAHPVAQPTIVFNKIIKT